MDIFRFTTGIDVTSQRQARSMPGALAQTLALLVGAYSFIGVLMMSGGLTMVPAGFASIAAASETDHTISPDRLAGWLSYALFALACVVGLYGGLPLARYALRVHPVKASGRRRHGVILAATLAAVYVAFILAIGYREFVFMVPLALVSLTAIITTFHWQLRGARLLDEPYILFLRRFSSFSDRSILAALLRTRPGGYRTAFLTPPVESPANYGPITLAFSGTSLRHPLRSCPLPVRALDVEWEDRIEDMARAAACVVIDPSHASPAIERELEIVGRVKAPQEVVWLSDEDARADEAAVEGTARAGTVVRYRRSWRAALPRIVLELLAVGSVATLVVGSLAGTGSVLPIWLLIAIAAGLVALAAPVIVQPSLARTTKRELAHALRVALAGQDSGRGRGVADVGDGPLCALIGDQARDRTLVERLERAAADAGLRPVSVSAGDGPRALRDAVRAIAAAELVLVDATVTERGARYLVGVAHGLGRRVVPVTAAAAHAPEGDHLLRIESDGGSSRAEMVDAIWARLRDPRPPGPVAALLVENRVFGENLSWRRIVAFLIDLGLVGGLAWLYASLNGWRARPFFVMDLAYLTIGLLIAYRFLAVAIKGASVGMWVTSLRVVTQEGNTPRVTQALGRAAAFLLTIMPGSSYLYGLYGPRYQVIEDVLSGTRVTRR